MFVMMRIKQIRGNDRTRLWLNWQTSDAKGEQASGAIVKLTILSDQDQWTKRGMNKTNVSPEVMSTWTVRDGVRWSWSRTGNAVLGVTITKWFSCVTNHWSRCESVASRADYNPIALETMLYDPRCCGWLALLDLVFLLPAKTVHAHSCLTMCFTACSTHSIKACVQHPEYQWGL